HTAGDVMARVRRTTARKPVLGSRAREGIMPTSLLRSRRRALAYSRGGVLVALAVTVAGGAQAACKPTPAHVAAVAALHDPVTLNARGRFVQKGKVLRSYDLDDLCMTRRFYDLIAEREAQERLLKPTEIRGYVQYYLSADELDRIHKHVAKVRANSAKS